MTDKKDLSDAFASGRKEIVLPYKEGTVTFYVNEIGFLASQDIALKAAQDGKNALALIVSESVTDENGNKFSYEETSRMKREFAEPLFNAVVEVNGIGKEEKN